MVRVFLLHTHQCINPKLNCNLDQWCNKGCPSMITDRTDLKSMGSPSKIDSVQNLITLWSDFHKNWDNYDIRVNPNVSPTPFWMI